MVSGSENKWWIPVGFVALWMAVATVTAQADVPRAPSFASPAQVLGTYQVARITQEGSVKCDLSRNVSNDERCGAYVWVIRTENQLALLEAKGDGSSDAYLTAFLMHGTLWDSKCDSLIRREVGRESLFTSKLCRATLSRRHSTRTHSSFVFNGEMGVIDPIVTLPIGILAGSSERIVVPNGPTVPDRIIVNQHVTGTVFFIPASVDVAFTLKRVGD